jgi:hypothetical protein
MTKRQGRVVAALNRVCGADKVMMIEADDTHILHIIAENDQGIATLSVEVAPYQTKGLIDVGDRVTYWKGGYGKRYGLIVICRDLNESIGIVPDGENKLIWEYIHDVEVIYGD